MCSEQNADWDNGQIAESKSFCLQQIRNNVYNNYPVLAPNEMCCIVKLERIKTEDFKNSSEQVQDDSIQIKEERILQKNEPDSLSDIERNELDEKLSKAETFCCDGDIFDKFSLPLTKDENCVVKLEWESDNEYSDQYLHDSVKIKDEYSEQFLGDSVTKTKKEMDIMDVVESSIQQKSLTERHICKTCHHIFKQVEDLDRHIKRAHDPNRIRPVKRHKCEVCLEKFLHPCLLRRHMVKHMRMKKTRECDICHEATPCEHSIPLERLKLYECAICNKMFENPISLRKHTRLHTGENLHPCDVCGRKFISQVHLRNHKMTHLNHDERPLACELCPKRFGRQDHLKAHIRTHTGEKPYLCVICKRSFACDAAHYRHMRGHRGEKNHKCKICNVGFMTPSSARNHMTLHSRENRNECKICKRLFLGRKALAKHEMEEHDDDDDDVE